MQVGKIRSQARINFTAAQAVREGRCGSRRRNEFDVWSLDLVRAKGVRLDLGLGSLLWFEQ